VFRHAAIALATGDVLIVGGWQGAVLASTTRVATVYNVASGLFAQVGSMNYSRHAPSAARLNDGRVLVVGMRYPSDPWYREADLYDPVSATFALTAATELSNATSATTLPDGTVLVTGSSPPDQVPVTGGFAERYDPGTGTFILEGPMRIPVLGSYTATRLLTGEVLFIHAAPSDGTATSSAELFR
jgi:hypothetical protein